MAVGTDSSNPRSYELEILTIVNNEGDGFDIRDIMVECNIYESIHRNFLMGELIISDAIGFYENAKLFGQESLRVKFKQSTGIQDETDDADIIDQIFRIYKIQGITRLDDTTQAFRLHFCSAEFLQAKRIRISQAFQGSMTDIAAKLAEDHLGIVNQPKDTKLEPYFEIREKSQGDSYHVIIPNWTVNYTINWLCSQAQGIDSNSGLQDSFFWYQVANGGYRMNSLASMMKQEYAGGRPFVYSPAGAKLDDPHGPSDSTDSGKLGMGRRILDYRVSRAGNVLRGITGGLFGSKQFTIDNTYKFYQEKSYNFLDKFYKTSSAIEEFPFVRSAPEILHIGSSADKGDVEIEGSQEGKSIGSYPQAYTTLTSDSSFVNDTDNNIHQANHKAHLGSRQYRAATEQLLQYYTINVALSARTDISCGQLINLEIPLPRPGDDIVDPKFYNGRHLITDIKWRLQPQGCSLNIKCMKDSVINQIETTTIEYGETMTQ
ncbi:MAG: hypothetical protein QGH83_02745 [Candidatus Pacebacteria bacterium]|jgi:hypothetical protein|nr:hypothetical protein [Candidatus Paceibacterota bacterium]|tara:strand:- start:3758 stop:5224 length:1467 start_codon:yes stop_codon:yes gene_type:complete